MQLLQNIINNFSFLLNDFIGISISWKGIGLFFLHCAITLMVFTMFYLVGERIRVLFFNSVKRFKNYINIALGYILIGTGLGILGLFSILSKSTILCFLVFFLLVSIYSWYLLNKNQQRHFTIKKKIAFKKDFVVVGVILFVLISFLRLMTPEITEDGYHTDLPQLYLATGTTMHETKELLHVIPYPQLPEMIYLIPLYFGDKEAARFIHFGFYLTIIFFLFSITQQKKLSFIRWAPLLFVSTPLVIKYAPSQYTDYFMLFTFLLSMVLLRKDIPKRILLLSGILFGAVISSKMWLLVYIPAIFFYIYLLHRKETLLMVVKKISIFSFGSLAVVGLWYIRAFLITGNPLYPLFSQLDYLGVTTPKASLSAYFGFNHHLFDLQTFMLFSPLFFISLFFVIIFWKESFRKLKYFNLIWLLLLMTVEQLMIQVYLPRYLISWYSLFLLLAAAGAFLMMKSNHFVKVLFGLLYSILFLYYFINTLLTLPYGWGWADTNNYLTRVLYRDNANYYDFDKKFDKWIISDDLVATYGIVSFYYADFVYKDIAYFFDKNNKSFDNLRQQGVTKLLIKGGDLEWFCKKYSLQNCDTSKATFLSTYPMDLKKYNLYLLK